MDDPYQVQHNFKVSIRLQDNTKAIKQINSDVFVGVSPRKTMTKFYTIRQHDLEFYNFLSWKMTINSSRVLVYAKLNIPEGYGNIIETDAFWLYVIRCRRWSWVSLVEQKLLTLPEHLSLPPVLSGFRVTRSLVLYVCFVDRCLSFCTFSFGHCVVCSSSVYEFWLPLWYLQTLRK
jgi:hypothetical protein